MRRLLPAVAVALALAGAGCREHRAGPPPERFLPADVRAAVVVPEAGRAASQLAALHATLATFPGAADVAAARGSLAAQLGLDPLHPDGLRDAGVDARRGAAVALLARAAAPGSSRGVVLLVLPVRDGARLEALLARLARERLGAELRALEPRGAVTPVAFRRAAGEAPVLAYLVAQDTALVAHGPSAPDVVAEAAGLAEERSLVRSAPYAAAQRALTGVAALAFAPPGSPLLGRVRELRDGLALGFSSGDGVLRARAAIPLGDRAPSFRALAGKGAAARLVARLAPGAALVARWDGDPGALLRKLLPYLPAAERARLAARGVDPERDLAGLLAPGAAAAVSLTPALDLSDLGDEALRADPLRLIRFEAVLPLGDPERARAVSDRLAPAPRRGRGPRDGGWRLTTPSGEIAWRLDGGRLLLAGGPPGALDALAVRLGGEGDGWRAPTDAAGGALTGGLGGAVLDAQRLVASVRALPEDAFGTGPSGFVVRSVVDRFLDPAARLAALSLRAELSEGALVLGLEVEARAAEARR